MERNKLEHTDLLNKVYNKHIESLKELGAEEVHENIYFVLDKRHLFVFLPRVFLHYHIIDVKITSVPTNVDRLAMLQIDRKIEALYANTNLKEYAIEDTDEYLTNFTANYSNEKD